MKKQILTITALLALGSTAVFADGTLRFGIVFDGTGQASSLTNIAEDPGTGTITQNGWVNYTTDGVVGLDGTLAHPLASSNWSISGIDGISTTDGFTIVFNASSDLTVWKDLLGFTVGSSQFKFELDNQNALQVYSDNSTYGGFGVGGLTASTWYNVALTALGSTYTLSVIDTTGALIGSTTGTGENGALSALVDIAGYDIRVNTANLVDNIAVYDGVLTTEQLQELTLSQVNGNGTIQVFSTIPEPSAFGLLAGAGALALVAARRRRSRKA